MKAKATVIPTDGYSTGDNVGVMGIKTPFFILTMTVATDIKRNEISKKEIFHETKVLSPHQKPHNSWMQTEEGRERLSLGH
jgi:hypothetical protein